MTDGWFIGSQALRTIICAHIKVTLAISSNVVCYVEWTESSVFVTNFLQLTLLYLSRGTCLIVTQCQKAINPLTQHKEKHVQRQSKHAQEKLLGIFLLINFPAIKDRLQLSLREHIPFTTSSHFISPLNTGSGYVHGIPKGWGSCMPGLQLSDIIPGPSHIGDSQSK